MQVSDRYSTKIHYLTERLGQEVEARNQMRKWMILGWVVAGISNLMLLVVQIGGLCR